MRDNLSASAALPPHVVGLISPGPDAPYIYAQFYRVFGNGGLLIGKSLDLGGFSAENIDAALASFWESLNFLESFDVQSITLAGVPLSATWGRPRMLTLLEEARRRAAVPISTDFEDVVLAAQALGLKKVAIASKWSDEVMGRAATYLAHAGIDVLSACGNDQTLQELHSLKMRPAFDVAVGVGSRAFREAPEADGLLLLGGHWPVMQAVVELEATFHKPVIANPMATNWAALKQSGLQSAVPGMGRLMDTLL
jgi:maleate cis-trans isomerase